MPYDLSTQQGMMHYFYWQTASDFRTVYQYDNMDIG
jgi:hypothetical protein